MLAEIVLTADDDPPPASSDPFGPPTVPTLVGCLHCGQEYESYLIEWRVRPSYDGKPRGFWCCPMPGCDGIGFGFDILPVDPDYQDEHGGWVHDGEEDDADDAATGESTVDSIGEGEEPPDDEALPW